MLPPKLSLKAILHKLFPKKLTRKEKIRAFVVFAGALVVGLYLPTKITITLTDSVKYRIFWMTDATNAEIQKGDYLLFNQDHPWKEKYRGITRVVKEVGCVGEDTLTKNGAEFFCNGVSLGKVLATDNTGQQLPTFLFDGVVPHGKYFMRGHDVKSYDSKYYGFITNENIIAKAIPLF